MKIDRFSLESGYARDVRVRVEFMMKKPLLLDVWIPFSLSEALWIKKRMNGC